MSLTSFFLSLLYPAYCVKCSRFGTLLCRQCQDLIEPVSLLSGIDHQATTVLDNYHAAYLFNKPIKEAMIAFKYEGVIGLAPIFAELLYAAMPAWPVTICTSVPLHPTKLKQRGFNQAELIAQNLAAHLQLPYQNLLTRIHATQTQTHLDKNTRLGHYADQPFRCEINLTNQHILLIDDVLTTGATLSACATALKQAGAITVCGLALAHGS